MLQCRTCLATTTTANALPLFPSSPSVSPSTAPLPLASLLAKVTRLQVLMGDNLPGNICEACHIQLCNCQTFIEKALESYNILRKNLSHLSTNGDIHSNLDNVVENNDDKNKNESENNCLDICDEIGITIENETETNNSLNNFHGDLSIVYSDKAVQVSLECEHHKAYESVKLHHLNGILQDISENSHCDKNEYIDKIDETDIKQEPEDYIPNDYDQMESYSDNLLEESSLATSQIKVEPLSEDDALKFHQEAVFCNENGLDDMNESDNEIKLNTSSNSENIIIEDDIKPTQDELDAYAEKLNNCDMMDDDKNSDASSSEQNDISSEYNVLKRNKSQTKSVEKCILCNRFFNNIKKLKRHVISQHSYYECIKCQKCSMNFMSSIELNNHMTIHNSMSVEYHCALCTKDFENDEEFKLHLSTHKEIILLKHGTKESTLCSTCNNSFGNLTELFSHISSFCGSKALENDIDYEEVIEDEEEEDADLPDQFMRISYSALNRKIKLEHNVDEQDQLVTKKLLENSCPHCSEKFENIHSLKVHLKKHNTVKKVLERSFVCTLCMFKFKRKDHLIRHLINVHRVSSENKRKKLMLLL